MRCHSHLQAGFATEPRAPSWRGRRRGNSCALLLGCNWCSHRDSDRETPQIVTTRAATAITILGFYPKKKQRNHSLKETAYPCSLQHIYNSQDLDAAKCPSAMSERAQRGVYTVESHRQHHGLLRTLLSDVRQKNSHQTIFLTEN